MVWAVACVCYEMTIPQPWWIPVEPDSIDSCWEKIVRIIYLGGYQYQNKKDFKEVVLST